MQKTFTLSEAVEAFATRYPGVSLAAKGDVYTPHQLIARFRLLGDSAPNKVIRADGIFTVSEIGWLAPEPDFATAAPVPLR